MRLGLILLVIVALADAQGRCRVSKVHAVCESRCEEEVSPLERTSVPPPGTLMPPTNIFAAANEGIAPPAPLAVISTPADGSNVLLELSSQDGPIDHIDAQNLAQLAVGASQAMIHPPMTCTEVEQHISPIPLLVWGNARTVSFGCADGRAAEETVGTWGGDFGELVTALNVYEQMTSLHLSQGDVTTIFRKYLQTTARDKFTTCMSGLAVRQLFGSSEDMLSAVRDPPEERKASLWLKIADSNFIGNEHIRFMLENPNGYSVRKELVQHVIHSFYDILWNQYDPLRDKLHVQILPGEHAERAIVSVTVPDFCVNQAELVPMISPRLSASSIVLLNPDAVQTLRKELSLFFSRSTTPVVSGSEMRKRFNVLAAGQGALTKKMMYDRIPTYSAKIS